MPFIIPEPGARLKRNGNPIRPTGREVINQMIQIGRILASVTLGAVLVGAVLLGAGYGGLWDRVRPESDGEQRNRLAAPGWPDRADPGQPVSAPDQPVSTVAEPPAPQNPQTAPPPLKAEAPPTHLLSHLPLDTGWVSGIREQQVRLIQDEATWKAYWQQHTRPISPAPPAPAVDFNQESILVVHLGEKRSGGYSVQVEQVTEAGGLVTATIRQTAPGPGDVVTAVMAQPFAIVRLPALPVGAPLEIDWR